MSRNVKLTIWALVLALVPFVFFLGITEYRVENGVVVHYSSLNLLAIGAGIGTVAIVVALLRRPLGVTAARPSWLVPVCVALLVLGTLQVVRGAGVLPSLTDCRSESGTLGFCTPTRIDS